MSNAERSGRRQYGKVRADEPHSWQEVNQRLACLGEADRQIRRLRDQFEQKVAVLKQQWLDASQPVAREKDKFERQIERFFWAHREEVLAQGKKSVELVFGRMGTRRSRSVVVENAAAVIDWLRESGLGRFLRSRTDLDRDALRTALGASENEGAEELAGCPGIHLRESDEFWYEVDAARLETTVPESATPSAAVRPPEAKADSSRSLP